MVKQLVALGVIGKKTRETHLGRTWNIGLKGCLTTHDGACSPTRPCGDNHGHGLLLGNPYLAVNNILRVTHGCSGGL